MNYSEHYQTLKTPQSEAADSRQRKNNAGGYTFTLDKWGQLQRFLILGTEGGTYYVGERELTRDNAKCVIACLDEDAERAVRTIVEVSDSGRAIKNDPAVFALALAAAHDKGKVFANNVISAVCRTGTHFFQFVRDVDAQRGWGRGLRRAVGSWYTDRSVDSLALQLTKYRNRNGWTHRDVLRMAHVKANEPEFQALLRYATTGSAAARVVRESAYCDLTDMLHPLVHAYEELQRADRLRDVLRLLYMYPKLTHEMVPGQWKNEPEVWEALLPRMGQAALLRNLAKMTSVGLLKPLSAATKLAASKIADVDALRAGRVHPMTVVAALKTYAQGHGEKGSLTWEPVTAINDALDDAFYLAFDAVEPTGKNMLLALDVSGSMTLAKIAGSPLDYREASAIMAMVTARAEKNWAVVAFTGRGVVSTVDISPKMRLKRVIGIIGRLQFGPTDCALPMLIAEREKWDVDVFHVYTDNETWCGAVHPHQALKSYRNKSGRNSKLCVVGMAATPFTIADPSDDGMLDVVGFDASAPAAMAEFARG